MDVKIIEHEPKYLDDILICYFSVKKAMKKFAPKEHDSSCIREDFGELHKKTRFQQDVCKIRRLVRRNQKSLHLQGI